MTPNDIDACAAALDRSRRERQSMERLSVQHPQLSVNNGYTIQAAGLALRRSQGERLVGFKMGLTSEAKRQQMNLHSPVYGVLTDAMRVPDGGVVDVATGIHPRIEPEVCFRVGRTLKGQVTLEEAAAACTGVAPAVELIDSRYHGFKYFSLPDVIADNSSSFLFVVGDFVPLKGLDLDRLSMSVFVNGEQRASAISSAISGHPLRSVVQLCGLLAEQGQELPEGSVVMAGGATAAEPLLAGQRVELRVEGLGRVSVSAR
jgi:2-oxo-3-hexenedioate decarboxylase